MELSDDGELHLLGAFVALIEGRDPLYHVRQISGAECLVGNDICMEMDALLKAQWKMTGSPARPKEDA
jgi:hypothetical protein